MPSDCELKQINRDLRRIGWAHYHCSRLQGIEQEVLAVANGLGRVRGSRPNRCMVERLSPMKAEMALPRSLSRIFSQGAFPLHTDTAYWAVPARFIVLGCVCEGAGGRVTTLLNWHDLSLTFQEMQILKTSPFRVINGRSSFFTTILPIDERFLRFDQCCMSAVSHNPDEVSDILSLKKRSDKVTNFEWEAGNILVFDNWRMLHGRGRASVDDPERTLLRVTVE